MPDFNEQLPEWQEGGIEPPTSKKNAGWQVDDKPPAGWLNWLQNRTYKVLAEIRNVLSAHKADTTAHLTAAERTAWNAKETTTGAQEKADAALAAAILASIPLVQKGIAGGVANLDTSARILAAQLPLTVPQLGSANTFTNSQKIKSMTGTNADPAFSIEGADFNAALQIKNTTATTGKRYSLYSYNGGDFAIVNETDSFGIAQVNGVSKMWAFPGGVNAPNVPTQTTADITYYVRTDGNDSNTGLANTTGGAFKTISKAISMIPRTVNHVVYIYVAVGTYAEEAVISGFAGSGFISLIGAALRANAPNYKLNNVVATRNSLRVNVQGFEMTASPSARNNASVAVAENPGFFEVAQCVMNDVTDANKIGVSSAGSPNVNVYGCELSNCLFAAFGSYMGNISVQESTGVTNNYRFRTLTGAIISPGANVTISGIDAVTDGGIIIPQPGVLGPWGDNTQDSRPAVWATPSASLSLSAGVWALQKYGNVSTNNLGGFNGSTGVFTSPQTGWYKIKASGLVVNAPTNTQCQVRVLQDGSTGYNLDTRNAGATTMHVLLAGEMLLYLITGHTAQIQFWSDNSLTVASGSDVSRLEIVRVA